MEGSLELRLKSAEAALTTYYGAKLELGKETDNQAEAALVNVETYVQLTLEKYYYPEDEDGVDKELSLIHILIA